MYHPDRAGFFTVMDDECRTFWTGLIYGFGFAFAGWGVVAAVVLLVVMPG